MTSASSHLCKVQMSGSEKKVNENTFDIFSKKNVPEKYVPKKCAAGKSVRKMNSNRFISRLMDQKLIRCIRIECFHMTSRRPCWCPKTMKRRPCWCPKPILQELNSFLMQTLSFVPIYLNRCWPREWKHSISALTGLCHSLGLIFS